MGVKGKRLRRQEEIGKDEKETEGGNGGSEGNEGTRGRGYSDCGIPSYHFKDRMGGGGGETVTFVETFPVFVISSVR
jgi:hypothetical protein